MTERKLDKAPDQAAQLQDFDFDSVDYRPGTTNAPELVVRWDSKSAIPSKLTQSMIIKASEQSDVGSDHPDFLEFKSIPGTLDVAARPTRTRTPTCVSVNWSKDNSTFSIDLSRFLAVQPIVMQRRTSAHIPVTWGPVPTWGEGLIIHFSNVTVRPVETGKRKSSKSAGAAATDGQTQK